MPSNRQTQYQFKIKQQSLGKAVGLNAVFYGLQDILQLVTMLILVRILVPEDYAIFALVISTHGLIGAFAHQSFIAHSLQVNIKHEVNYDNYMTFSCLIQLFLFLVCNLIAFFYEILGLYKNVSLFLHVLSFTYLIEWLTELIFKVYERNGSWQRRRMLQLIWNAILSGVSISLAVFGLGIWSLIIPTLLQQFIFLYDLFIYHKWRFHWHFDWKEYRAAWIFGWYRIGSLLLQRLRLWVEPWLLIQFIALSDLGFFTRGFGLAQLLTFRTCVIIMMTVFPYFSKLRLSSKDTQYNNNKLLLYIMLIVVPSSAVAFFDAPFITAILYGENWRQVAEILGPMSILCGLSGMIYVLSSLSLANQNLQFPLITDFILLIVHFSPFLINSYFRVDLYINTLILGYSICMLMLLFILHFNLRILNIFVVTMSFLKIIVCCAPIIVYSYFVPTEFSVSVTAIFEIVILQYLYFLLVRFTLANELSDILAFLSNYRISAILFIK